MSPWIVKFHSLIEDKDIPTECFYNYDQAGLYDQNLPNIIYGDIEQKKLYHGCKKMKYKTRITVMLCTSESCAKCPLLITGKSKNPKCCSLETTPPLYKEQNYA